MDLTKYEDLQTALHLAGIKPKKGLGQHFLMDREIIDTIIGAAEVGPEDTVLEIGPGLGVMTYPLCRRAKRVVAVEQDRALADLLERDQPENLKILNQDILDFDLRQMGPSYKVAANLPYFITSKIIRLLMEADPAPSVSALLVQREVAERILSAPGNLSVLALSVQFYAEPSNAGMVERFKFWPAPAVDSAILRLVRRPQPMIAAEPARLFRLIKAGFGEKRKQMKNSLAGGLNASAPMIDKLLRSARIKPTARAQELDWKAWQRLYNKAVELELI